MASSSSSSSTSSSSSPSAKKLLLLAMTLWSCMALGVTLPPSCEPKGPSIQWLPDADDCAKYYVCHGRQMFTFDCGENVWNQDVKTCVGKGSDLDKCTIAKELEAANGNSKRNSCTNNNPAVFAKADNCAQYYNCSSREATVSNDPHVVECKFPLLFNVDSKRCDHYATVKCGDRPEPLDPCDYVANQCWRSAHCIPCMVRFPSCKGLPDGLNPWVGRENSPYFVQCQNQRPLSHGQCDNSNGTQIFDPVKRVCAPMDSN